MSWQQAGVDCPCPVCGKPDWCLVSRDGAAAICSRIESDRVFGDQGAGWPHHLRDDGWASTDWRSLPRQSPESRSELAQDFGKLSEKYVDELRPESRGWLASELGLKLDSLTALCVGYAQDYEAFSFPMREPNGNTCGIRLRRYDGSNLAVRGSRAGLFFVPGRLNGKFLLICEGPSDTAALLSMGYGSVIGHPKCGGASDRVVTVCRWLRPAIALLIPEAGELGRIGAEVLASGLKLIVPQTTTVILPNGCKDVREAIQDEKNADRLRDQIGALIG